ncbi:MAG TPA: CHRD domain-containing protein [Gaiellaceae bacterium]|jgi:hypothetical protein
MRKRILAMLSTALVVLVAFSATALAKPSMNMGFSAKLNTTQEVPKETGAAMMAGGSFTATLTGKTLKWKLTFAHLTGKATAAHIHLGAKGKSGGVIVALCGPCTATSSGSTKITAAVMKDLSSGGTYVNVHTAKNPNGEIRGQIM